MPIDFISVGSRVLPLTVFSRVVSLKQSWVAETGFIQLIGLSLTSGFLCRSPVNGWF